MEPRSKITAAGLVHLPNEVRESLGKRVTSISNAIASVIFPTSANLSLVKRSIEIVLQDLDLRIETRKLASASGGE